MNSSELLKIHSISLFYIGLTSELQSAYQDSECIRKRLRLQEEEMLKIKHRASETEEELNRKYSRLIYF